MRTADSALCVMDLADVTTRTFRLVDLLMNQNAEMAFPLQSGWTRENAMKLKTSRDIPGPGPRKDEQRAQEKAVIKDADKTDQADRDAIHGDGDDIGLDRK
jgi:hypothetical protein